MMQRALIAGYFGQDKQYYSASKGEMLTIAQMPPKHAANAAEKLLVDAKRWATESGADEARPISWMTGTALFRALLSRAEGASRRDVIAVIDGDGDRWEPVIGDDGGYWEQMTGPGHGQWLFGVEGVRASYGIKEEIYK